MTLPFLVRKTICGFKSLPLGCERQSVTTFDVIPVASSMTSLTEMPSTRSSKWATPVFSVMIGMV